MYARLVVDDIFLKKECQLYRWQKVEVLETRESRHTKTPKKVWHTCRIINSGRIVSLRDEEIEIYRIT